MIGGMVIDGSGSVRGRVRDTSTRSPDVERTIRCSNWIAAWERKNSPRDPLFAADGAHKKRSVDRNKHFDEFLFVTMGTGMQGGAIVSSIVTCVHPKVLQDLMECIESVLDR